MNFAQFLNGEFFVKYKKKIIVVNSIVRSGLLGDFLGQENMHENLI